MRASRLTTHYSLSSPGRYELNALSIHRMRQSLTVAVSTIVLITFALPNALAQSENSAPSTVVDTDALPVTDPDFDPEDVDGDDTADIDTESTVDTEIETVGSRFRFRGDVRPLYNQNRRHPRNSEETTTNQTGLARLRFKTTARIMDGIQAGARVAWRCTTDDCGFDWTLEREIPTANGLQAGQATFDELYLHFSRREAFDLTIGRQQTRFVLRGGVFARSLDRVDSNNTNVTWTDGAHLTFRDVNGWEPHFVVQRNTAEGTGSIRRGPLDFSPSAARQTYFVGLEKTEPWGPVVQRAFDVSYFPKSLLVDGDPGGRREDYWAFVGRLAARWPVGSEGMRIRTGLEIGYAPEVPSPTGANVEGDVGGLAWNVVVSLMEFMPRHSVGINYGETGAGWLLSPQFTNNQDQVEVRYQWRPRNWPAIEVRLRYRSEIDRQIGALRRLDVIDGFVRLTWQMGR